MRVDAFDANAVFSTSEIESGRWRKLCTLFAYWNRRCVCVLVVVAIFMPWPPLFPSVPAVKPSRRAPGNSPVAIVSLALGTDGETLATTDESGQVTLWHASEDWSFAQTFTLGGHAKVVDFSSDGHYLAIGGDGPHVAVWDLEQAKWENSLRIPGRSTSHLRFSPDGRALAVSSYDSPEILLWDLAERRARLVLKGHSAPVLHVEFALDGKSLASATGTLVDSAIIIWNVVTGRPERRINGLGNAPQAIAYSPDSRLVAAACPQEKSVRIWDVRTGRQVQVIAGHSQSTRSIAFSPDGRLLATAAGDGTAGLWSVATGRETRRLDGEADVLHNIAFSPDGHTLAATANDGDIRLWDVDDLIADRRDD
jgi:WD40 repeat protein